jgi:SAM-dependent methyltransferase
LLDVGSGPIQYPEYLEYSRGFSHRVCLDISRRALNEARARIGAHGRFVVGDLAYLPFRAGSFDGAVCLHTVHHLPGEQHRRAFEEIERSLAPAGQAVVVQSWGERSGFMRLARLPIGMAFGLIRAYRRVRGLPAEIDATESTASRQPSRTFTRAPDYGWVRSTLSRLAGLDVRVWRSVSTSFLRALIHRRLWGGAWLRLIYALEEAAPRFLGRHGQYAMILFHKRHA